MSDETIESLHQEIERLNQLVSEGQEAIGHYQAEVKRYSLCGHDHSTAWWQLRCEQAEQERDRLRTALVKVVEILKPYCHSHPEDKGGYTMEEVAVELMEQALSPKFIKESP